MSAPFGGMPTRWDPDGGPSSRVAVVVPGAGYSPSHPLLEFGRQSLLQHGWSVQQLWWDQPDDDGTPGARARWVCEQVQQALESLTGVERVLILAKSLGTLSSPVAAQYGLDAIWMTPLFSDETSIAAIAHNAAAGAHQLLVGGLADPSWDADRARALGCEVVDFAATTHFVNVPGDVVRTAEIHVEITRAVEAFLTRLDADDGQLRNFGYLIDGKLAGMAHPGYGGQLGPALDALRARGVTAVVSLDEAGISGDVARAHGLAHRHIPVVDFEPPTLSQADAFVAFVDAELEQGGQVAAHCQAGIGRTGTMLAAYLVAHGSSTDQAIEQVRRRRPHSVESESQRRFLAAYAAHRGAGG